MRSAPPPYASRLASFATTERGLVRGSLNGFELDDSNEEANAVEVHA